MEGKLNELALFAGAGGGILGGKLLGWKTVCAVEIDAFCREVLLRRQLDGCLPRFPIWDDIRTFDGKPWCGCVDVISGGFPCQDISCAGKGKGIDGERSGLWREMARVVCEVGPQFVFVENSPMLTSRGLGRVLGDLASMGYDARWGIISAESVGSPQCRKRIWIYGELANSMLRNEKMVGNISRSRRKRELDEKNLAWSSKSEPTMVGMAHWVANRLDRLKAIGNGQVPAVARLAWDILNDP